jgi:hypothetical protein
VELESRALRHRSMIDCTVVAQSPCGKGRSDTMHLPGAFLFGKPLT